MAKHTVRALGIAVLLGVALFGLRLREVATPSLSPTAKPIQESTPFTAQRIRGNPFLRHTMDARLQAEAARYGYINLNGPSLIRVPNWVEGRLGEYYLYFAHHKGEYIRLAHADRIEGPWEIYGPGVLQLKDSFFATEAEPSGLLRSVLDLWQTSTLTEFVALAQVGMAASRAAEARRASSQRGSDETRPHIASPDLLIDHDRREIRMYFHGLVARRLQMTRVAISTDGLHFRVRPALLAAPYLRVFQYGGTTYGIAMPGLLYRSADGLSDFEVRRRPLLASNTRHVALWARGDTLYIFYTRVGDAPERILCSTVNLASPDWDEWEASAPFEILAPELPWEGAELPVSASTRGESPLPVRQLRDPAIFVEGETVYLLYSAAGEQAIAIARLIERE